MIPGLRYSPGFNAGLAGGSAGMALSFVGAATSSSSTITIPAAAIAGDWAILFDAAYNSSGSSIASAVPTGWSTLSETEISIGGSLTLRSLVSHRKLTGGGGVTGLNNSAERKIMLVFRTAVAISGIIPSTWNKEATSGDPTAQVVSASGAGSPLGVFALAVGSSSSPPAFSTETPAMTNLTVGGAPMSIRVGYTIYNSSPVNQSIDMNDVGTNILQSGYVRFT